MVRFQCKEAVLQGRFEAIVRRIMTICVLVAAISISGCGLINWVSYVFAPASRMKTIKAEFGGLKGKSVAVVVYADLETQVDYPTVQLELCDMVAAEMRRHIKGVRIIDPRAVIRYQSENPRWDIMPPEKLCDVFDCDYVLLISLMEFSTRERGSVYLVRGRIKADVSIYQAGLSSADGTNPVWRSEPICVQYPRQSTLGVPAENERAIRVQTERLFAIELVKKFYDYKVPKEADEGK